MGYFPNGTAGEMFEAEFCSKCVHGNGECQVWFLHLMNNYDQFEPTERSKVTKEFLDALIFQSGPSDLGTCRMFHPKEAQ